MLHPMRSTARCFTHAGIFPGAPVVRTPCLFFRGHRFNPWSENKDPTSPVACSHPHNDPTAQHACLAVELSVND